jgi:hypothetical protein
VLGACFAGAASIASFSRLAFGRAKPAAVARGADNKY